jgi:two-component system CheB/CheR fusion protein
MASTDSTAAPEPPIAPTEEEAATTQSPSFPIVGVGGSSGGLEAFTELLGGLPPDPGVAFLFVLHLEPHHKSQLPEILARVTPLPVREATEGMAVQANNVYLIPPNANMALTDHALTLSPRPVTRAPHMPIDHLFRSLADVQKSRAVGVILSGGGTDGTLGFQSIKAEGGITFAQDERSARQASMPRSAVSDGCVDYVLSPRDIAAQLARLIDHPYTKTVAAPVEAAEVGDPVGQIIALLRSSSNVDFSHYKRATMIRRIQRRMALRGLVNFSDYLRQLRAEPAEVRELYQDFLIRVTQFFRDPEAFQALKDSVFPALVQGRTPGQPIRMWVAGCSTGEEVYSLAISLLEYLDGRPEAPPMKILATDLNESALEKARSGVYIDNIEIDVSPERLRRFFSRVDGHYQISKNIRDLCVFSRHNMAADPPFSHLDLVSCRNVLIYMDAALQKRVLPVLHYALNPEGFLFLGSSENVGPFTDLFSVVDAKHRLFSKKSSSAGLALDFVPYLTAEAAVPGARRDERGGVWSALEVQKEADRIVLARFAPVGVIVDETMTVLQFRGRTAPFLEPAPGMASLDLMRMLREGLLAEVRGALNRAKAENVTVVKENVRLVDPVETRHVRVEAIPFKVPPSGARFFLVLFEEAEAPAGRAAEDRAERPGGEVNEQQVAQLQQELGALREYLQSVIEEQESTNEELKSANEEILSANEELQSTNEELQTAKEEAQSANEELATVNEELRHRNAELVRVNDDLMNLLSGVGIPIVMVGRDLRVRRFTPVAEKVFNLIPTDLGRPISDIKPGLKMDDLPELISRVIDELTPFEGQVQDKDGLWYLLRIRPYVTLDNKIDGASVVLLDIDALKHNLERSKAPGGKPAE